MNLLEHIHRCLEAPRVKALAIRLLNRPWEVNVSELHRHVPRALLDRFSSAKKDVQIRVNRLDGKRYPFLRVALDAVGVSLRGSEIDGPRIGVHDKLWVDQIWTQVVEDLEESGRSASSLDETDRAAFVLLYTLAHTCLFVLTKVHTPLRESRRDIELAFNDEVLAAYRLYWFAHYLSFQSLLSDHLLIRTLLEEARKTGKLMHIAFHARSSSLKRCSEYFADKFLSLHPDYLQLMDESDRVAVSSFSERLGLIVYIYLSCIRQQLDSKNLDEALRFDRLLPFEIDTSDLRHAGFRDEAVKELLGDCLRKPIGDRFLVQAEGSCLQIGDLSLKCALQMYCHISLEAMRTRGDWFEQRYIANYIRQRVSEQRYRVFLGVNDESQKYDADIIVEDLRNGTLLFCQIKHRTTAVLPHLRDEMSEYSSNSRILRGVEQLESLRACMGSDGVLTRVRGRIGQPKLTAQSLVKRARYVLIHNIENLNFCTSGEIVMYEWNTLRNLMKGNLNTVVNGTAIATSIADVQVELDKPHDVMEALWRRMEEILPPGQPNSPSFQWNGLKSSRLLIVAKRSLRLKNLGLLSCGTTSLTVPVT
jgi:hypothetical protein